MRFPKHELESLETRAREYLEEVKTRLSGTKATLSSEVRVGNPAEEIIKFAKENDTRLVAMSTHGYSAIGEWVLGSVAHKVLHNGSTPILLGRASGIKGGGGKGL